MRLLPGLRLLPDVRPAFAALDTVPSDNIASAVLGRCGKYARG
jgi:hypothetical protein